MKTKKKNTLFVVKTYSTYSEHLKSTSSYTAKEASPIVRRFKTQKEVEKYTEVLKGCGFYCSVTSNRALKHNLITMYTPYILAAYETKSDFDHTKAADIRGFETKQSMMGELKILSRLKDEYYGAAIISLDGKFSKSVVF